MDWLEAGSHIASQPFNLNFKGRDSFSQVLHLRGGVFFPGAPDVFYCVSTAEIFVHGDFNALDPAWVCGIVRWSVDWVSVVHGEKCSPSASVLAAARAPSGARELINRTGWPAEREIGVIVLCGLGNVFQVLS
jgi:hypothetical protein